MSASVLTGGPRTRFLVFVPPLLLSLVPFSPQDFSSYLILSELFCRLSCIKPCQIYSVGHGSSLLIIMICNDLLLIKANLLLCGGRDLAKSPTCIF